MKYDTPRLRAKAAGHKRYEGLPCINCGNTIRLVNCQSCVLCKQAKKQAQRKRKRLEIKLAKPPKVPKPPTEEQKQRKREYAKAYAARPERLGFERAKKAKRRCDLLNRTPKWLTKQDKKAIRATYDEAVVKSAETGIVYHVDHIIPLRGKYVSGLHVPSNLQLLTAEENLKKLASYEVN